jgi:dethiobiotin synthetase
VIAARPGLGTINHTLMTVECARRVGLEVAAVVLTPWPAVPGDIEHSNRETIARLGKVEVETLPMLALRQIGPQRDLPVGRWLTSPSEEVAPISVVKQQESLPPRRAAA